MAGPGSRPLLSALACAWLLVLPGEAIARVLPPRAAEVVTRTFQGLDPAWRIQGVAIESSRVLATLCPNPSGDCIEVRLTDPEEGCPEGDRLGPWCLFLPPGDPSGRLREVLVPLLSATPPGSIWEDPGRDRRVQPAPEEPPFEAGDSASTGETPGSRWWATFGFLAILTIGFLPGFGLALGIRARFPGAEGRRGRMAALAISGLAILMGAGLAWLPWKAWGILLGGGVWAGTGFLAGIAWPGPPTRAFRRSAWVWGILVAHGLGAEFVMARGTGQGRADPDLQARPALRDRSAMLGATCAALFPEEPPSPEAYREMRRALRQTPPPRLWLHLGSDLVQEEPAGLPLPALVGTFRPGEVHWDGGLPGTPTDVHLRQALSWTRRDPPPSGIVLYLNPATDVPALGERNACCGAGPLFAFAGGEPRISCERTDLRGRWRVLLGQVPPPPGVEALGASRLARQFGEAWRAAFGRLLAGPDERAAALSRLRVLLPFVRDRLEERGVRLLLVLVPSPGDLVRDDGTSPGSREWVQTMEICRVLDLPCRNAREAWVPPRGEEARFEPFLPGTGHLSPAGERRLARWVAEHLASLEDPPE